MILLSALLVGLAVAQINPKESKEKNYGRFIAEQTYSVPYKSVLTSDFVVGQTLHAIGTLNDKPKRVDFDFRRGLQNTTDTQQFSIRFKEGMFKSGGIVYNAYQNGNWSKKEQKFNNPFKANEDFDLRLRFEEGKIKAFANRMPIGTYNQLMPWDGVKNVFVYGDLAKLRLFHYGGRKFDIPYTAIAPLTPGKRLDISGMPTGNRININLYRENKEFALQLSIRFKEGAIVRNAMSNGAWGAEEREGKIPISKAEIFDLTIVNESFSYQIFFNGKRFGTFAHRGSPNDVKTVEIDGEIEVHTMSVNDAVGV